MSEAFGLFLDQLHEHAALIAVSHGLAFLIGGLLGDYDRRKYGRDLTLREHGARLAAIGRRLTHGRR